MKLPLTDLRSESENLMYSVITWGLWDLFTFAFVSFHTFCFSRQKQLRKCWKSASTGDRRKPEGTPGGVVLGSLQNISAEENKSKPITQEWRRDGGRREVLASGL